MRTRHRTLLPLWFVPLASLAQETAQQVLFRDVTEVAGIDFQHTNGRAGELFVIEVKGSGAAFVDYDNDDDLDLYAVNGNNLPGAKTVIPPINHLYRNNGDGTFSDVTHEAGVGDTGYGHGVAAADYDNDGDQDLYIANYGPNVLYRNEGNGTFTDFTDEAGVAGEVWSASAAFCDLNNDGWLDLYVANYLVFDINGTVRLPTGPGFYDGEMDVLYLNDGDGTFRDVTRQSIGEPNGKGLGVVCFDYDEDGDLEIYVANDGVANLMYENQGNAVFKDVTFFSGTGVNGAGETEAGMGVDSGDYDNDGDMDLFVTNYKGQSNTLMRNDGGGIFTDVTSRANLVAASLPYVTFGTGFFDPDNDGDLDIFVANGHTEEELPDHEQPDQIFANDGNGRYEDISARSGRPFNAKFVGRGAAFGDFDNDGDVDVAVSNKNGPLNLLQNEGGNQRNWLVVKTVGTSSNRDGIGARVTISAPEFSRVKDVKSGYSMFSSNDLRVYFGLGELEAVDVTIRWPSGIVDALQDMPANKLITVTEGTGRAEIGDLRRIATDYPDEASEVLSRRGDGGADLEASVDRLRRMLDEESTDLAAYLAAGTAFVDWVNTQTKQRLDELLATDTEQAEYLMQLGEYFVAVRQWDEAVDAFRRAAESRPNSVDTHSRLAFAALTAGRYQQAVSSSRRAMALGDNSSATYMQLARALAGLQRNDEAESVLHEMIERYPRSAEAHVDLGNVYVNSDQWDKALDVFRRAVRTHPNAADLRYQLAEAHRRSGNMGAYQEQMAIYEMLETGTPMFRGGMSTLEEIELLEREIRMNPMYGRMRADRQLALRYDRLDDDRKKELYSLRARAGELKEEMAVAIERFRRAVGLALSPEVREKLEDTNALRLRLVRALNMAAGYDVARSSELVDRGYEALASGAYDEALIQFRNALLKDPDNVSAYHGLARVHLSVGFHLTYALRLAEQSCLMDQSLDSYRILADVYRALGDVSSSERSLSMAIL